MQQTGQWQLRELATLRMQQHQPKMLATHHATAAAQSCPSRSPFSPWSQAQGVLQCICWLDRGKVTAVSASAGNRSSAPVRTRHITSHLGPCLPQSWRCTWLPGSARLIQWIPTSPVLVQALVLAAVSAASASAIHPPHATVGPRSPPLDQAQEELLQAIVATPNASASPFVWSSEWPHAYTRVPHVNTRA